MLVKPNIEQGSFDFDAAPISPEPAVKLDAEGHFWWASLLRSRQQWCIAQAAAAQDEAEIIVWSMHANEWKAQAATHEAKGNMLLDGERG